MVEVKITPEESPGSNTASQGKNWSARLSVPVLLVSAFTSQSCAQNSEVGFSAPEALNSLSFNPSEGQHSSAPALLSADLSRLAEKLSHILEQRNSDTESAFLSELRKVPASLRYDLAINPDIPIRGLSESSEAIVLKLREYGFSTESLKEFISLSFGPRISRAAEDFARAQTAEQEGTLDFRKFYEVLIGFSTAMDIREDSGISLDIFPWVLGISCAAMSPDLTNDRKVANEEKSQSMILREGFLETIERYRTETLPAFRTDLERSGHLTQGADIELSVPSFGRETRTATEIFSLWKDRGLPVKPTLSE